MGHIGEECGLGAAGYLGRLQSLRQLLIMYLSFLFSFQADFILLPLVDEIQRA